MFTFLTCFQKAGHSSVIANSKVALHSQSTARVEPIILKNKQTFNSSKILWVMHFGAIYRCFVLLETTACLRVYLSHVTALPKEPCSVRSDCLGALHNYINCFHFLYVTQALIEEIGHYLPAYPLLYCKCVIRLININIDYLALHSSVRQLPLLQKLAKIICISNILQV